MRCCCQICGTYMVHAESLELGCVCPECYYRCKACLGTNSVMSREDLQRLKDDPELAARIFAEPEPPAERYNPDEYGRDTL